MKQEKRSAKTVSILFLWGLFFSGLGWFLAMFFTIAIKTPIPNTWDTGLSFLVATAVFSFFAKRRLHVKGVSLFLVSFIPLFFVCFFGAVDALLS
ncbi:MAG: hypothetical protein AB7F59_07160 [Bdellovibrionales bacterium]